MLVWELILLFNRSDRFEIYFGTEHMDASVTSVASPVHTTKDAHYKGYTTLLPNISIYDMNASTSAV